MSAKKDITQMVHRLRRQGWKTFIARNGHWRLESPDGQRMTCSATPKTDRAYRKARADARALGAEL